MTLRAPVVTTAEPEVEIPEAVGRRADPVAVERRTDNHQQVVRYRGRRKVRAVVVHTETDVAGWERPGHMMAVGPRPGVSMQPD